MPKITSYPLQTYGPTDPNIGKASLLKTDTLAVCSNSHTQNVFRFTFMH